MYPQRVKDSAASSIFFKNDSFINATLVIQTVASTFREMSQDYSASIQSLGKVVSDASRAASDVTGRLGEEMVNPVWPDKDNPDPRVLFDSPTHQECCDLKTTAGFSDDIPRDGIIPAEDMTKLKNNLQAFAGAKKVALEDQRAHYQQYVQTLNVCRSVLKSINEVHYQFSSTIVQQM